MKKIEEEIEQFRDNLVLIDTLSKQLKENNESFNKLIDQAKGLESLKNIIESEIAALGQKHFELTSHLSQKLQQQNSDVIDRFNKIEYNHSEVLESCRQLVENNLELQKNTQVQHNQTIQFLENMDQRQRDDVLRHSKEQKQSIESVTTELNKKFAYLHKMIYGILVVNIIAIILAVFL